MDFQSIIWKNWKKELPFMKLYFIDIDEVIKHELSQNVRHPVIIWPFSIIISEKSRIGKINLLVNLVLKDKYKHIYKR